MEEIKFSLPKLKTVKKTTYTTLMDKVHLNINPENEPMQNMGGPRSQSFKNITEFVPHLKPKKSTIIPPTFKLNNQNRFSSKDKDDFDKQMSGEELVLIENSSSISSSDMENSFNENIEKNDTKDKTYNGNINSNNFKLNEIKEFLEEDEETLEYNKNIKNLRRKMSQIKARVGIVKSKETEEFVHMDFKNNYDIGLKDYEKENEIANLHGSLNNFENKKENEKPKIKSIFDVLSKAKKK